MFGKRKRKKKAPQGPSGSATAAAAGSSAPASAPAPAPDAPADVRASVLERVEQQAAANPVAPPRLVAAAANARGLQRKRKKKRPAKRRLDVTGTIIWSVILFVIVVALVLWIQNLFSGLDARIADTDKRLEMVSSAAPATQASSSGTQTATAASNKGSKGQALDVAQQAPSSTQVTVLGRVVKAVRKGTYWNVTVDPAQLLVGKAASSIAAHQGKVPTNGQFIDDLTHTTRDMPCSDGAVVTADGAPTTAKEFFAVMGNGKWANTYFTITLDSDYVVSMVQVKL